MSILLEKTEPEMEKLIDPFSVEHLNKLIYQTPYFLFDKEKIKTNYHQIKSALPDVKIYYPVKCNSHIEILCILKNIGSGFEIASYNELKMLKEIGVDPCEVLYSMPIKPWQHVQLAFRDGVTRFAFDSFSEAEKIAQNAPRSKVYLRIIVNDSESCWPLSMKFGAEPSQAVELMKYAQTLGLEPYGITFHVGSQTTIADAWEHALQTSAKVMTDLQNVGITLQMLNVGGGFPARYSKEVPGIDEIGLVIRHALKKYLPYGVKIVAEPGRACVANTAVLVTSIIARTIRSNKNWLYLDVSAFHGLLETMPCQGNLVYPLKTSVTGTPCKYVDYTISGHTCDALDTMFNNASLPDSLKQDDKIYIYAAGAYTLCFSSSFNGFDPPKVYFI